MEARYVNVYKLMEFANNMKDKSIDANDIARFPWADVRENVHAHWEIVYDEDCDDGGKYICGNCRHAFSFGAYFELCRFDYCPNCGAKMDEREEND